MNSNGRYHAWLPAAITVAALLAHSPLTASETSIVDAARSRDITSLKTLLAHHGDANLTAPDGTTALHWAAHWDDGPAATLLLGSGAHANARTRLGISPLTLACENGSAAMVDLLLKHGADSNTALPTGETALITCAGNGDMAAVQALLSAGADVNASEQAAGQTALMWAAARDNATVVKALIEAGANISARTKAIAGAGGGGGLRGGAGLGFAYTPILFAARNNAMAAATVLLDAGANVNDEASDGVSVLLTAVHEGYWSLAHTLLERGADPNANKPGYTALAWICGAWENDITGLTGAKTPEYKRRAALGSGKLELVQDLLAHGADPRAPIVKFPGGLGRVDLPGATPFLLAAHAADAAIMGALVAAGADPSLPSEDGTTPLMMVAGYGRSQGKSQATEDDALTAARAILDLGADINAKNQLGDTALHAAAYWGVDGMVQYLVDAGAALNPHNKAGSTPMQLAEGFSDRSTGGNNISNTSTAELLKRLGGSDVVELVGEVDYTTEACPRPVITLKRELGMFDPSTGGDGRGISIETNASTSFKGLQCSDLAKGTRITVRGGRDMKAGWNGLVQATEIARAE